MQKREQDRIDSVPKLIKQVEAAIDRVESGGRVLDFNLPKRCVFCAKGNYQLPPDIPFPRREDRRSPPQSQLSSWPFQRLQEFVTRQLGFGNKRDGPIPIYLVCDVCGKFNTFGSISQATSGARNGTPSPRRPVHLEILRRRPSFRSPRIYCSVSGRSFLSPHRPIAECNASLRFAASPRYFSRRAVRTNSEIVDPDCRATMWSVFQRSSSR